MTAFDRVKEEILLLLRNEIGEEVKLLAEHLTSPPHSDLGDLALACFPLAAVWKKSPADIAGDLAGRIAARLASGKIATFVSSVSAHGPYLNFSLNIPVLAKAVFSEAGRAGTRLIRRRPPLVMVEVCSPNTHKEIHVGHLRNILLSRAVVSLRRTLGEKVITASYLGDSGAHVARTLWALKKFHSGEKPPREKGRYLGKIYTEASRYLEKHPEAKKEIQDLQRRLEAGDRSLRALWKKTRVWSLREIKNVFSQLSLPVKKFYFESEMEVPGKRLVAELLKKGIAQRSQGAVIIDLASEGLGAFLILKSDGTALYATKDLALAQRKFQDYPLDLSLHVVDARQTLYFNQLFAALKKIGLGQPMIHLPFEFVTLKEGAMSSRLGNIITYEDFRDEMIAEAERQTEKRHQSWPKKKIEATARSIALGAMTIGMLKRDNDKKIVFDLKEALSFEGFTGPYLQYTLARAKSILGKARGIKERISDSRSFSPEEKALVLDLARFQNEVALSAAHCRPARLVAFLFDLAKHFSEFYEKTPVLKAAPADRAARLELVSAVANVLESAFRILGIPVLEEM